MGTAGKPSSRWELGDLFFFCRILTSIEGEKKKREKERPKKNLLGRWAGKSVIRGSGAGRV